MSRADPEPAEDGSLDRESLRDALRRTTDVARRILLERVVEELSSEQLGRLVRRSVREARSDGARSSQHALARRARDHAAATRRGDFHGELAIRNRHGEREPWQTRAWLAATAHLFELALEGVRPDGDEEQLEVLRILVELACEVDDRPDELVVFEDDGSAGWLLGEEIRRARTLLDARAD